MSKRWQIQSLRRFNEGEVYAYLYLGIGGLLSAIYFTGVMVHSQFLQALFVGGAWQNGNMMLQFFGYAVWQSIVRALAWLPQLVFDVVLGGTNIFEWLTGKGLLAAWQS